MIRFLLVLMLMVNIANAQTVVDVIVDSEAHQILEAAVSSAELVETLSGDGPFTIFAPTDAAFQALPEGLVDDLLIDPKGALTDVLLYHVLGAKVLSSDLSDGQTATTLNEADITVTINDEGVFINDAKVTMADIETDNGVVHVIDAVLIPPSDEPYIFDIVADSEDHTILETALIAAGGEEGLSSSGYGPFTLFAPTDAAFEALPEGTIDTLLANPQGDLLEILSYHLFLGTVLSSDLSDGQVISTYYGEELTVTINDDGVFINNAKVTVADIEARNGVVHVIDAVLLPPAKPATVVEVIVNSEDHNTLETAVGAAGLVETLSGEGPFTVFAPTDAAFDALPEGTVEALLADPTGDLAEILKYHVLGTTVLSSILINGLMTTTLQGDDITVTINDDGVFINNAKVTVADIETDNGVVHVIDAVLLPPDKPASVVDVIVNSEDHITLAAAVSAAGLVETLSSEGPFTVFAPTDAAFAALPEGTVEALLADPTGDLTQILLYHVLNGTVLSSDLSDGQTAATLQGDDITVTINDDGVFINDAKVTVADIETDNGVVHVIDAVLLPTAKPASVVEVIVNSEDHITLAAAVSAAGLVETLSGEGPFTVFAPTDAAFAALPEGTVEALLADPTGDLAEILKYHVLGATVLSSDLSDGQTATTLQGTDIIVTINDDGVFINGAKVTVADIETENGVVHVIDAVLDPTMVNIIDIDSSPLIQAYPNPAIEMLTIETLNNSDVIETLFVYNSAGSLVASYSNLNGLLKTINVADLTKGTYNVLLTVNDKNYSKTFIKH